MARPSPRGRRWAIGATLLLLSLACIAHAAPYHAVIFVHGIVADASKFTEMDGWVKKLFPGIYTYRAEIGDGSHDSLFSSMEHQLELLHRELSTLPRGQVGDGVVVIAHSQGTLLSRAFIERFNDPPVRAFISLAGIHGGLYGTNFVNIPWVDSLVSQAAYTDYVQNTISFASFWKDPFHLEKYLERSTFLADINNERAVRNDTYRMHLASLERLVLTFGDLDEAVMPHESGHFEFYSPGEMTKVVPLEESQQYKEDWLGLRTLTESGRVSRFERPYHHNDWTTGDKGRAFFDEVIVPVLNGTVPHAPASVPLSRMIGNPVHRH